MVLVPLAAALDATSERNSALAASYKDGARSILSRSISSLALSMADQRRELGKTLLDLAAIAGTEKAAAELETGLLDAPRAWSGTEACDFLNFMVRAETSDYELLACLAGAFVPLSPDAAERLASLSEQARKRAAWAQDHLDLLGICPP